MRIKLIILILVFYIFSFEQVHGQGVHANINFLLGLPNKEFKENVDRDGYGIGASCLIPLGDSPLFAGLNIGALYYNSKDQAIEVENSSVTLEPLKGAILAHLVLRTQKTDGRFRPYVEGLVGLQHFFSRTSSLQGPIYGVVEDGSTLSTNEIAKVFSFGGSCGCMYSIHTYSDRDDESKAKEILLDLRLRYLYGGETEFIKENYRIENDNVIFDTVRVRTDLFTIQLGVSFVF